MTPEELAAIRERLDNSHPLWQKEGMGRDITALLDEVERLKALLREVAQSGVEHDDPRIGYLTVQIDRVTWEALQQEVGK